VNRIEKALMHGLFIHLHHNIDKAIDFGIFKKLNDAVGKFSPGTLMIGPEANDDAAVFKMPGESGLMVAKMESHCSPCVPRPYDSAATGAGGAMRDVVAMGGRPLFLLDFIGTRPLDQEVIVGPCGFKGSCDCGECQVMTSGERVNLIVQGIRDMCETMGVFVVGGGLSTSFSDIVPAVVAAVIGKLVIEKPLTKPAKRAEDRLIIVGETSNDGNDTLYRAGLADVMRPALALFREEKQTMDASLAAIQSGKINACSDLGAAGIGAAVSESVRFGNLGAEVDLAKVPLKIRNLTPEEILICETQARMVFQVAPEHAKEVINLVKEAGAPVADIGRITSSKEAVFYYNNKEIARIPHYAPEELFDNN
jgi:phosphoribosylformylglycinamidine synthase